MNFAYNFHRPTMYNFNPLSAKLIKWPNTLKQFVDNLPTNCLSVFGHFVELALKGLIRKVSMDSQKQLRRCFVKKEFLKISQNLQESTCTRVSFLTHLTPKLPTYRNQSIDLQSKSNVWFLCNGNFGF